MINYEGKILDNRYEIREIIGVGGMAVVYKAYDNIDDRIVAVKILKEEFLANEEFRRRFKNESKAIAVLSHPNIVKVYDVSYGDRLQYIVMEYVEGITLKEYIQQQGRLNSKEAVFFIMQVLRALQHAHDKGIVHRDIKPQNILLLENGAIKVTDFGIARFSRSETRTMTDSTIGSVHYISPEQARGDVTDDKTDIYSVGVMLYEMLTGTLPFESDNTVSVAIMQLQKDPVKPRNINPEIPVGLEQIILHAMQKNIHDRYQSAAEVILDLEEFKRNPLIEFGYNKIVDEPTRYIPNVIQEQEEPEEEPVRVKNRTIPILLGVIFSLIVVLGIGSFVLLKTGNFPGVNTVKVPDFVGMVYSEESFKEDYPNYNFKITEQVNPDAAPNQVISQTPEADSKIKSSDLTVTLVIATNSEMTEIPSGLMGSDYATVVSKLTQAGLQIKEKAVKSEEFSDAIEAGTVVEISPSEGTKVSPNSVVTVKYISYEESSAELIKVPNVSNLPESSAKQVLVSSGFTVSTNYEYSDTKEGYVIYNTLVDQKIPKGSSVTISVSKGKKVEQTTSITVMLPESDNELATVTATLDGTTVFTKYDVLIDGSEITFEVKGSESLSVVKFFIDGLVYYKCNINFTSDSPAAFNETYFEAESNDTITIPSVIGTNVYDAKAQLEGLGFTNITIEAGTSNLELDADDVYSQTPSANSEIASDTAITLYYVSGN